MSDSIFSRAAKVEVFVILIGLISLTGLIFLFKTLELPILQSDPYLYLLQSRHWWLRDLHLPAYAFIIWSVNLLFFGSLPEALLLHLVAATTWIGSVLSFALIANILRLEGNVKLNLIIAYAFFPLIGLTFAAWPISDSLVCLFVNLIVISCLKKDWLMLAASVAFALLLHKIAWGFCFFLMIYALIYLGFPAVFAILSTLPLLFYWIWIACHGDGFLWIIEHDIERHFPSHSILPIFDGIIGTMLSAGFHNFAKGITLLFIYLLELFLFIKAFKNKQTIVVYLLLPLLILGLIVNQWLAIAVLRFAKISIVAFAILLASKSIVLPRFVLSRKFTFILLLLLLISQFSYATYMKSYFKEGGILDEKIKIENSVMESKGLPIYERGK